MHHIDSAEGELSILVSLQNELQLLARLMLTEHESKHFVVLWMTVGAQRIFLNFVPGFEGILGIEDEQFLKRMPNLALANLGSKARMLVQGLQWPAKASVSFLV